jgi:hypothetical protein
MIGNLFSKAATNGMARVAREGAEDAAAAVASKASRIPVRPARFNAPSEVKAYVDEVVTTMRHLATARKASNGLTKDARAVLLSERVNTDLAEGITSLRSKVASTVRDRRSALAAAQETIDVATRRYKNTSQPGARLAAHYDSLAASKRNDAAFNRMMAGNERSAAVSAAAQQNHGVAAAHNASASLFDILASGADSEAMQMMSVASRHRARTWPADKASEIVGRRGAAVQAAKDGKAALKRAYDATLASDIPVLQTKLKARNEALAPVHADYLAKRNAGQALGGQLNEGLTALDQVRKGVPFGKSLQWVLQVKDTFDLGDYLGDARKAAEQFIKDSLT